MRVHEMRASFCSPWQPRVLIKFLGDNEMFKCRLHCGRWPAIWKASGDRELIRVHPASFAPDLEAKRQLQNERCTQQLDPNEKSMSLGFLWHFAHSFLIRVSNRFVNCRTCHMTNIPWTRFPSLVTSYAGSILARLWIWTRRPNVIQNILILRHAKYSMLASFNNLINAPEMYLFLQNRMINVLMKREDGGIDGWKWSVMSRGLSVHFAAEK